MTRKSDLEQHIRESYRLIREYEDIQRLSDDPKEQTRSRRAIEEQWDCIKGYLAEYVPLCERLNLAMPEDIIEIAVTAGIALPSAPKERRMKSRSEAESLKRRLAEAEENLRLIRERKSEFVQQTDVPLQLIKDERRLEQEIEELRARLALEVTGVSFSALSGLKDKGTSQQSEVSRESDKDESAIRAKIKAIDKTLAELKEQLERGFIDFGRYSRLKTDWERQKAELEAQLPDTLVPQ